MQYCPPHFVTTGTPTTDESTYWILERLVGRFYLHKVYGEEFGGYKYYPFFEDPQEAILYELTWS